MEQWKVTFKPDGDGGYKRIFTKEYGARRDYGMRCKDINEEEGGSVSLLFRKDLKSEWEEVEVFTYDDEEEE